MSNRKFSPDLGTSSSFPRLFGYFATRTGGFRMPVYRTFIVFAVLFVLGALLITSDRPRAADQAASTDRFLGHLVKASLHVERAEGGIPAGATVHASAIVDGADAFSGDTKVEANGNVSVEFKLPTQIERGDGTLALAITDGGVVETISKTIP